MIALRGSRIEARQLDSGSDVVEAPLQTKRALLHERQSRPRVVVQPVQLSRQANRLQPQALDLLLPRPRLRDLGLAVHFYTVVKCARNSAFNASLVCMRR